MNSRLVSVQSIEQYSSKALLLSNAAMMVSQYPRRAMHLYLPFALDAELYILHLLLLYFR